MTSLSNAGIAQRMSDMVALWDTREREFREWTAGTPEGGPYGDGRYPLSSSTGTVYYIPCPASLAREVTDPAAKAVLLAAQAEAAKIAAATSAVRAEEAQAQALAQRNQASTERASAETARLGAQASEANAQVYRDQALAARDAAAATAVDVQAGLGDTTAAVASVIADATAAGAAQVALADDARVAAQTARTGAETARTGAETARTGAETAKTAAEAAKTAAEASAASVNASNIVHITGVETITGNKTFTGTLINKGASGYLINRNMAAGWIALWNSTDGATSYGGVYMDSASLQLVNMQGGWKALSLLNDGTVSVDKLLSAGEVNAAGRIIRRAADGEWGFLGRNAANTADRGGVWLDAAGVALYNASFATGVHANNNGTLSLFGNVAMQAGKNLKWGNAIQQHITLWETSATAGSESSYGIGVQNSTWYARSDAAFAFYYKGTHAANQFDPGSNGRLLFKVDPVANLSKLDTSVLEMGTGGAGYARIIGNDSGHQIALRCNITGTHPNLTYTPADTTTFYEYGDTWKFRNTTGERASITNQGMYLNGWYRANGATGLYFETYGGGWTMTDNTWLRSYNQKPLFVNCASSTVARWESPSPTFEFYDTDEGSTSWLHHNSGNHGFLQHNAFAWGCYRDSGNSWIVTGNIAAYASDARLKKNPTPLRQSVLDRFFDNFPIIEFDWDLEAIERLNPGFSPNALHEVGSYAQSVEKVFKSMVVTRKSNIIDGVEHEGIKTLLWEKAVPFTVAGVQQLREENKQLKAQIASILARLEQLENAA